MGAGILSDPDWPRRSFGARAANAARASVCLLGTQELEQVMRDTFAFRDQPARLRALVACALAPGACAIAVVAPAAVATMPINLRRFVMCVSTKLPTGRTVEIDVAARSRAVY